ncbi:MAG: histidine kinase, partial [Bacteroidota bacterium]
MVASDEGVFRLRSILSRKSRIEIINGFRGAPKDIAKHADSLWIGTSHGLFLSYNDKTSRCLDARITTLCTTKEGSLWVGTTDGLYSSHDGFKKNYALDNSILNQRIVSIIEYQKDVIFLVTASNQLLKIKLDGAGGLKIRPINKKDDLYFGHINQLKKSVEGPIYICSSKGVFLLDPATGRIEFLSKQTGLNSNNAVDLVQIKDSLWILTDKGLNQIDLRSLDTTGQFDLQIVDLKFAELDEFPKRKKDFFNQNKFQLQQPVSELNITFANVGCFPCPELKFQHQVQKGWLPLSHITFANIFDQFASTNQIVNTNNSKWNLGVRVSPGRYRIESQSLRYNKTQFSGKLEWEILILPYWYQTIWPWLIGLILITILLLQLFTIRIKKLRLESEKDRFQLASIKAQMNPHFFGNSINAIQQFFYPPQPKIASTYIKNLNELLRKTLQYSEVDFIGLEEEIQYATAYLEMIKLRYREMVDYSIKIDQGLGKKVQFPSMFLQPILENASIHGKALSGQS